MSTANDLKDSFFNDLSSQAYEDGDGLGVSNGAEKGGEHTKPKRVACLVCRKRKLRCDGVRPSCGNCSRLGHDCGYSDVRRKSGPRRGYVKELEARLHQVEHQLKTTGKPADNQAPVNTTGDTFNGEYHNGSSTQFLGDNSEAIGLDQVLPNITVNGKDHANVSWEMVSLGVEEPLPLPEMIDDLDQIYFDSIHKSIPMIHKHRYLASLTLAPTLRPPICLRYAMWTMVASITERYSGYVDIFYRRARKYIEADEMKGAGGECLVSVSHAQAWALIAAFEFKTMYFPRAWMSVGRTSRLVQMLGLQRVDHEGLEVKRTLAPPKDWIEREERRRTFWMAFCNDRYASIGTGWPMTFDEKDIFTKLPSSLEAFEKGIPQVDIAFVDALSAEGASNLSALGAVVVIASLFGQNLMHLHRSYDNDDPDDPTNGGFWKRHRQIDSLLSTITLFLPEHLKMPTRDPDPNIPFLTMALHTAVICLHQAAILKAEKHQLDDMVVKQSVARCFNAAEEVHNVMQMISHIAMGRLHPFIAFCLYVAARVLIHAYQKRRDLIDIRDKYEFLMKAMQAHMKKTPLTASFLAQLQVELEAVGLDLPLARIVITTGDPSHPHNDYLPPVVPRHSKTQPTIHDVRASSSAFIDPDAKLDDTCTVFDLPPRLRSRVESMSKATGQNPVGVDKLNSGWKDDSQGYAVTDTEMTPGDQSGFTEHLTPSSAQQSSSHTSFSPILEKASQVKTQSTVDNGFFASPGFQDFSNGVDSGFAISNDWTSMAPSMMSNSVSDQHWTQFDNMAWDTQGINLGSVPHIDIQQWRAQNGLDGSGNGNGNGDIQ